MSPIPQMEGLAYRIHAGFGRHLAGVRAFHLKSLSICVICVIGGFTSLFQVEMGWPHCWGVLRFPDRQARGGGSSLKLS